jgi:hypothetical protein
MAPFEAKIQAHLMEVQSIQQEILSRMREGASFSTAHKEGGTTISFSQGRFVRADYGESSRREEFRDPNRFLAFLRQFYDWETSRNTHPNKVADVVAWRLILRLLQPARSPSVTRASSGSSRAASVEFLSRYRRLRLILGFILLVGAAAFGLGYKALSVRTIGVPIGEGCGTPDFIAMLVARQEPYIPSLHRNPNNDRFRVHLLVEPRDGKRARRLILLQSNLRASESHQSTRILGFDGGVLWVLSREILGYDYQAGKLLRLEDLRRVNPSLEKLWPQGYYEVFDRLRVSTRDRSIVVEIDPRTLIAQPVPASRGNKPVFPPHPVNSYLSPSPSSDPARLDQSLIRDSGRTSTLRLANPDGQLLTYWQKTNLLQRRLFVARVDASGRAVWEADTGIGELQQIFPDSNSVAFFGTRPRVQDKLPEPVLTILRNDSGAATVHSLWIKD